MPNTNTEQSQVKILLVDDKIENLIAMQKTLAPLRIQIITAGSGNDALKLMLEHDIAVVLLDVMMPDINGFEVAELMHQNDETKYIPIIFITAINKSEQSYIQGMEAGAIDYLYKPIDPIILLSKVRVFIDLYTIRNKLEKTIDTLNSMHRQLQENNAKLKQLSEEDMLTKASNRRHFEELMNELINSHAQDRKKLYLLFIDIDDFKVINDTHGHRTGDLILQTVVDRIKQISISSDMEQLGINFNIIARLGGDEFAIVASTASGEIKNLEIIPEYILKAIQTPIKADAAKIEISLSIGIAAFPDQGDDLSTLLKSADIALYKAKSAGKNTYAT